ncbi:hypothetical protein [Microbacterium oxydans]|uniref:hypothetical protein n=1 Tax=Microbacterium oxydans TaxID=82380 RepID=UPI001E3ACFC8|nr:hypothetical protein [Microbacterium oxydans]
MCNTRKSSLAADSLPMVSATPARDPEWDGLLSRYADIVTIGETAGCRHASPGYHSSWLRRFGRRADDMRLN